MAEKEQNRTEQATPFKLEESRKQGQVAKSLDFNSHDHDLGVAGAGDDLGCLGLA